jgi:hypothetical protein
MTALSIQAALAIALKCLPPAVAPVMVGIAQHESGLDPAAVRHNPNGTADVGIAQVNTSNFGWTGLTWQTALEPCANFRAGAMVLFAKYNGNPPDAVKAAYANDVLQRLQAPAAAPASPPCPAPDPTGWEVTVTQAGCVPANTASAPANPAAASASPPCPAPDPSGWDVVPVPAGCPSEAIPTPPENPDPSVPPVFYVTSTHERNSDQ